jgi:hypothetical protein
MATRAQVEQILVKRCGPLMTKAGMAVTFAGANIDLADPIAWGLRQLDYDTQPRRRLKLYPLLNLTSFSTT